MHTEPGAAESYPRRNAASICPVRLSRRGRHRAHRRRLSPGLKEAGAVEREGSVQAAPETVTDAAHGFDQPMVARGLERLPKPANVGIHRAILDEYLITPDLVEKLAARVDAVGASHEVVQQPELGSSELDLRAAAGDPVRG